MPDPFQSQPPKKVVKAAKTVPLHETRNRAETVGRESINATALAFIRAFKKARANQ